MGQCSNMPIGECNNRRMCQYANEREDDNVAIERWLDGLTDEGGNDLSIGKLADGPTCQLTNIIW